MKNKVIDLFGNGKVVQNKDVKYSELLEKFMSNFQNDLSEMEFIEDMFDFAINAWNFGNLKVILPKDDFKKTINFIPEGDTNIPLLNKMIDHKVAKFKKYTNFIVDFELKETGKDPNLTVITQEEDTYFASMLNDIENQDTPDDFEENYINRHAIVIKPLQPFFDWLNALYPNDTIDTSDFDGPNIYLVDENIDNLEAWLKKKYDRFFTMELNEWHTNKKEWPQKRNHKMFKQWFQADISTGIYDLEKKPIFKF